MCRIEIKKKNSSASDQLSVTLTYSHTSLGDH